MKDEVDVGNTRRDFGLYSSKMAQGSDMSPEPLPEARLASHVVR
jgi:pantothenate kinase type III